MRDVPAEEFRFKMKFALSRLPASIVLGMNRGGADKQAIALEMATDRMVEQFSHYTITAPDVDRAPLCGWGNRGTESDG